MGIDVRKPVFGGRWFANNKGADQTAGSLISAFIICLLEGIISKTCHERNFHFLANLCCLADWFESHFVGNPEDRLPIWLL